jgi:hypothetical protein
LQRHLRRQHNPFAFSIITADAGANQGANALSKRFADQRAKLGADAAPGDTGSY